MADRMRVTSLMSCGFSDNGWGWLHCSFLNRKLPRDYKVALYGPLQIQRTLQGSRRLSTYVGLKATRRSCIMSWTRKKSSWAADRSAMLRSHVLVSVPARKPPLKANVTAAPFAESSSHGTGAFAASH